MAIKNKQLNDYAKKIRESQFGNEWYNIDDLPLTAEQKKCVIEWYAKKVWIIMIEAIEEYDNHCKHYDPLKINSKGECSSYVFDLEDGGRHHKYKNLNHLEEMITKEVVGTIKQYFKSS